MYPLDWWSLGITIFKLLAGKLPFNYDNIEDQDTPTEVIIGVHVARYTVLFNEVDYSTIQDVEEHPDVVNFISSLLNVDERLRLGFGMLGSAAVKNHEFFAIDKKAVTPPVLPAEINNADVSNAPVHHSIEELLANTKHSSWIPHEPISKEIQKYFESWDYSSSSVIVEEYEHTKQKMGGVSEYIPGGDSVSVGDRSGVTASTNSKN